jgi:hypothetical protein
MASNCDPSNLCLPKNLDYSCVSLLLLFFTSNTDTKLTIILFNSGIVNMSYLSFLPYVSLSILAATIFQKHDNVKKINKYKFGTLQLGKSEV